MLLANVQHRPQTAEHSSNTMSVHLLCLHLDLPTGLSEDEISGWQLLSDTADVPDV